MNEKYKEESEEGPPPQGGRAKKLGQVAPPHQARAKKLGQVAPPHQARENAPRTPRISNSLAIITFFGVSFLLVKNTRGICELTKKKHTHV